MIIVVLPAYNEADNIGPLIEGLTSVCRRLDSRVRIVVVNDGSTDGTRSVVLGLVDKLPVKLVDHQVNLGLGPTLRDGLATAADLSADEDVIVTMDADATHDPAYLSSMIKRLDEGYDIVIASRFVAGAGERGLSVFRRTLSRGAGLVLRLLFPIAGVSDYTCGYRVFRARIIKKAFASLGTDFAKEKGFSVSPEVLLTLSRLGAKVSEVPFVLKYDLKKGKSKIRILRTIIAYLKMMWRLRSA